MKGESSPKRFYGKAQFPAKAGKRKSSIAPDRSFSRLLVTGCKLHYASSPQKHFVQFPYLLKALHLVHTHHQEGFLHGKIYKYSTPQYQQVGWNLHLQR
jgi:hypothetical protein